MARHKYFEQCIIGMTLKEYAYNLMRIPLTSWFSAKMYSISKKYKEDVYEYSNHFMLAEIVLETGSSLLKLQIFNNFLRLQECYYAS